MSRYCRDLNGKVLGNGHVSGCTFRKLRPSMMQHLLRRLVFDVPLLNEHTKMPLKVRKLFRKFKFGLPALVVKVLKKEFRQSRQIFSNP